MSEATICKMRIPGLVTDYLCECRLFSVTVQHWSFYTHWLPETRLRHTRYGYILHCEWLSLDLRLTLRNSAFLSVIFHKRRIREQYEAICRKS